MRIFDVKYKIAPMIMIHSKLRSLPIILFALMFFPMTNYSQNKTLWLMNGKKISVQSFHIDSTNVENPTLAYTKLNGREKECYTDEVFSITGFEFTEMILYQPKPEIGDILSQMEMKQFVIGMTDARSFHISPFYTLGGYTAGLVGALIPQPSVSIGENTSNIPAGALIPIAYSGFIGTLAPSAAKLKKQINQPDGSEYYLMGLEEGVKKKVIRQGILGAGTGFVAGILILILAN